MGIDFGYFLGQKYAQLQQQANATSQNADTARFNAETGRMTGAAQAALDRTRANLLPGESVASVKKMGAETNLLGEQSKIIAPESAARIRGMDADTRLTGVNADVAYNEGVKTNTALGSSLQAVMAGRGTPSLTDASGLFRLPDITKPAKRAEENNVSYMDRTGWGF